jgi:hypothetical protein
MLPISGISFCESIVHNLSRQQNKSTKPIPSLFRQTNNSVLSTNYTQTYTRPFFSRINWLAVLFAETPSLTTTTIKKV